MQSSTTDNSDHGVVVQEEGESSNANANAGTHVPPLSLNDSNENETFDDLAGGGVLPPLAGGNPNKKTLVLDLDGTLVDTVCTDSPAGYDFCINLDKPFYVFKRPGVDELLQHLGSTGLYEIVIFTAGTKPYADAVVDKILDSLPPNEHNNVTNRNIIPPTHRLARDYCSKIEGVLDEVKDLSILGRNLKNVIFVDDRPTSFYLHRQNGIAIDCWTADDTENKSLFSLLDFCLLIEDPKLPYSTTKDVRQLIRQFFSKKPPTQTPENS